MSTGQSYLNSNVSLISKASIRYEGTLFSIDPHESTITLSNVKSFGTEDRQVDKFLAPKDTLFEYIIFKANDIKELIVDEPLNDPAIVQAQMPPSASNTNTYTGFNKDSQSNLQANGLSSDAPATLNGMGGSSNQAASAPSVSSTGQAGGERYRSRGSTPSSSQARSPISELSSKVRNDMNKVASRGSNNDQSNSRVNNGGQQRRAWDGNRPNNSYQNNQRGRSNYQNNNNNQMNRRPGYNNNYSNTNGYNGRFRAPRNNDRVPNHLNNSTSRNGPRGGNYSHNNSYQGNSYPANNYNRNMMRSGGKLLPQTNPKVVGTLKTEFDFEKANEAFQQMVDKLDDLDLSTNGEESEKAGSKDKDSDAPRVDNDKSEKVDDEEFYDKAKSFFDKISCEAIERTKGSQKKFDWKQERKLNAETFGIKVTYRPNPGGYYRRPGGYNGGYRSNMNQNRRYNGPSNNLQQPRSAPRTNSS